LNDLEAAEMASGRQLITVRRADGVTQKLTSYEGHPLLDAAESLYLAARNSPNYSKNPSAAITDEMLDEAVASLPACPVAVGLAAAGERAPMDAGDLMADAVLKGMWTKIVTAANNALVKEFDMGGDPELVARKYAKKIEEIGKDIKHRLARERLSALSTLGEEDMPWKPSEVMDESGDGKNNVGQLEGGKSGEENAVTEIHPDNVVGVNRIWGDNVVGVTDICFYQDVEPQTLAEAPVITFHPDIVVGVTDSQVVETQQVTETPISETVNPTLQYALEYAAAGIAVFPLHSVFDGICSCRKGSECQNKGKHPLWRKGDLETGVNSATTDEVTIRSWFGKWESANLGIAMGGSLRLIALDSDPRNGGDASVCDLVEAHGPDWLNTHTVRTGGNGNHFLFRLPEGVEVHKSKIAPGIDVKASGGYLVAPPSVHASGRRYEVEKNVEIALTPDWLVEELTRAPDVQPSKAINFQEKKLLAFPGGAIIRDGERDIRMFKIASGIWNTGITPDEMYTQLLAVRDERCELGTQFFSDEQVWAKVQSVYRQAANKGWSLPTADDAAAEKSQEVKL
jgi:putative DNA primase/helicase